MHLDRGLDFSSEPLLCSVTPDGYPDSCGYGCATPDYTAGFAGEYCADGCWIPSSADVSDPFSEFDGRGFRGVQFCSLTCASPAGMFRSGVLPPQCANATLAPKVSLSTVSGLKP